MLVKKYILKKKENAYRFLRNYFEAKCFVQRSGT